MQGFRTLSVFFDRPDEIEWADSIEVKAGNSSLGDVIFASVVDMALVAIINIDSQFN